MEQYKSQEKLHPPDVRYSHLANTEEDGVAFDFEKDLNDRRYVVYNPTKRHWCSKRVVGIACLLIFLLVLTAVIGIGFANKKRIIRWLPRTEPERNCTEIFSTKELGGVVHYSNHNRDLSIPHMGSATLKCPPGMDIVNGGQRAICIHGEWSTLLGTCKHLGGTWLRLVTKDQKACYSSSQSCKEMGITAGRPEIFHNEEWGTFCDMGLDAGHTQRVAIAETFCKQLGLHPRGSPEVCSGACEGRGADDSLIHFNHLSCPAGKGDIAHCSFSTQDLSVCTHANDIGLRCGWEPEGEVCVDNANNCANYGSPQCFSASAYAGNRAKTRSGRQCLYWSAQDNHTLGQWRHNYCRNPNNQAGGPWCYTKDPRKRWEYCFRDCNAAEPRYHEKRPFRWNNGDDSETFEEARAKAPTKNEDENIPGFNEDSRQKASAKDSRESDADWTEYDEDKDMTILDDDAEKTEELLTPGEETRAVEQDHLDLPPKTRSASYFCHRLKGHYDETEMGEHFHICEVSTKYVYWRIDKRMSWSDGRKLCQKVHGGDLMSIHNEHEQFIASHLASYEPLNAHNGFWRKWAWIGIYRKDCKDSSSWSDGTSVGYTKYWEGEPNCLKFADSVHEPCGVDAREECIHMTGGDEEDKPPGWNDTACCAHLMVLCKAPAIRDEDVRRTDVRRHG